MMRCAKNGVLVQGFTLLEMMVVLILVGIVAAMATPNFLTATRQKEVNAIAQNITATVNFATAEAARRGAPVYVYPANYRVNGKLNGPATSWEAANGILAFADDMSAPGPGNLAVYNQDEEIRGAQLTGAGDKKKVILSIRAFGSQDLEWPASQQWGLMLLSRGALRLIPDFRAPKASRGDLRAKITVSNKINPKICAVVWLDVLGKAYNCAKKSGEEKKDTGLSAICACSGAL